VGREEQVVLERPDRGHAESFAPVRLHTPGQRGALCRVRVTGCDDEGLIGTLAPPQEAEGRAGGATMPRSIGTGAATWR
jgi:hypothetical protein